MHDCDKVLRVEATAIDPDQITAFVTEMGFVCAVLD
jgi:hypothetical protein